MFDFFIDWDDDDDPSGNVQHLAANSVTKEEVEEILYDPHSAAGTSRSSGRPLKAGTTSAGRYILVVYEEETDGEDRVIRPVTAYEPTPP